MYMQWNHMCFGKTLYSYTKLLHHRNEWLNIFTIIYSSLLTTWSTSYQSVEILHKMRCYDSIIYLPRPLFSYKSNTLGNIAQPCIKPNKPLNILSIVTSYFNIVKRSFIKHFRHYFQPLDVHLVKVGECDIIPALSSCLWLQEIFWASRSTPPPQNKQGFSPGS